MGRIYSSVWYYLKCLLARGASATFRVGFDDCFTFGALALEACFVIGGIGCNGGIRRMASGMGRFEKERIGGCIVAPKPDRVDLAAVDPLAELVLLKAGGSFGGARASVGMEGGARGADSCAGSLKLEYVEG